jgi:Flp pilus assembly protein TadG
MKYFFRRLKKCQSGVVAFIFAGVVGVLGIAAIGGVEYATVISGKSQLDTIAQQATLTVLKEKPETQNQAQSIADGYIKSITADDDNLKNVSITIKLLEDEVNANVTADLKTVSNVLMGGSKISSEATAKLSSLQTDINIMYDSSLSMNMPWENIAAPLTEYKSGAKCYFACHTTSDKPVYEPEYVSNYDVVEDNINLMMETLRQYDAQDNIRVSLSRFSDKLTVEQNIQSYLHRSSGKVSLHRPLEYTNTNIKKSLEDFMKTVNTEDDIQDILVLISDGDNRKTDEAYSASACRALKAKDVIIYTFQLPISLKRYKNPNAVQKHPFLSGQLIPYAYNDKIITDKTHVPVIVFGMNFGDIHYNGTDNAKSLMQECATSKRHYTEVKKPEDIHDAFEAMLKLHVAKHIILTK